MIYPETSFSSSCWKLRDHAGVSVVDPFSHVVLITSTKWFFHHIDFVFKIVLLFPSFFQAPQQWSMLGVVPGVLFWDFSNFSKDFFLLWPTNPKSGNAIDSKQGKKGDGLTFIYKSIIYFLLSHWLQTYRLYWWRIEWRKWEEIFTKK